MCHTAHLFRRLSDKGLTNGELFGHAALAVYDRLYPYYIGMYRHLDEDLKGLKRVLEL